MVFQHTIPFEDQEASDTCAAFFAEIETRLLPLDVDDQSDILLELQSHLFEVLKSFDTPHTAHHVTEAINSIDTSYIDELLILNKFDRATAISRLPAMASAFWSYLWLGGIWTLIGGLGLIGYATALAFIVSGVLGIFQPDHVGLFRFADGTFYFGYVSAIDGAEQFYGQLYAPLAILVGTLLFLGLNTVLTRKLRKRKR